jgi:hypothetical protein
MTFTCQGSCRLGLHLFHVKHTQWKMRLKDYLRGDGEPLDPAVVSRDDACALGKWLYGPGQQVQQLPEYQALREHHRHFHALAGKVVQEHLQGHAEQAQALLNGEFQRQTAATVAAIRALRDAVEGGRRTAHGGHEGHAHTARPHAHAAPVRPAAGGGDHHWNEF